MAEINGLRARLYRSIPVATAFLLVLVTAIPGAWAADTEQVLGTEGCVAHERIAIEGNNGFTAENGVVQGDGSALNPFVISGWNIDTTTGHGIVIMYTTAHFVVRDVCLHSGSSSSGVYMYSVMNGDIESCTFSDNYAGIQLTHCRAMSIDENEFLNNNVGVYVTYDGNDVVVTGNTFSNSKEGLVLAYCTDVTVTDNVFQADGMRIFGYDLGQFNSHEISGNSVNGLPILYYKDCAGLDISGIEAGEIIVANCADVRVSDLQIQNVECAILLGFVQGAIVENCEISSCTYLGIDVMCSADVEITGCLIQSNWAVGIGADDVTRFTVSNNILTHNGNAVMIWSGSEVEVFSNSVMYNGNEIYFAETSPGAIRGNEFISNQGGTFITQSSGIVIEDNLFSYSVFGLVISETICVNVQRNQFWGNGIAFFGNVVGHYNSHTIAPDNMVNGKPLRYFKDLSGLVLNGEETGQLILANCQDVKIKNLRMEPVDYAVEIAFCDLVSMRACWISGYDALCIDYSNMVTVSDCRVSSEWGVAIIGSESSSITIVGNSIRALNDYAILLYTCSGARIIGNNIVSPPEYGIGVEDSEDVLVNGNRIVAP